jgi:DNA/RNA-binding domain of Phe-tRNA-synthetase-like protein
VPVDIHITKSRTPTNRERKSLQVINRLQHNGLLAAVVVARGVVVEQTSEQLKSLLDKLVEERKSQEFPSETKEAVRNLLKSGGFKPSGRNKPASEYLAQAAREGRFPLINNLVDINNYISLKTGLPISLLDADAIFNTLILRHGADGERYVFNSAGQEIDLAGLICACSESDMPLGNPVKDSIAGKIKDQSTDVVGIMYAPNTGALCEVAKASLVEFAELLSTEGKAKEVETILA